MWHLRNLTSIFRASTSHGRGCQRYPNLEELEQRDVPAPLVIAPAVALGQLFTPVLTHVPSAIPTVNLSAGTAFNAAQALAFLGSTGANFSSLPGSTGGSFNANVTLGARSFAQTLGSTSPSLGFPTASSSAANIADLLFSSSTSPALTGAPNPVRTGPVSPITPGAGASLAGEAPYLRQDIALSGGGNRPDEFRPIRTDGILEDSQPSEETNTPDSAGDNASVPDLFR
jgi:hypothetical protein